MLDAAVFRKRRVEIGFRRNIECDNEVDIEVAVTKFEITFRKSGLIRSNEDFNVVAFDLVAKVVCLLFVESDNKVAKTVCIGLKSFFRFEEFDRIWDSTRENCRRMLPFCRG